MRICFPVDKNDGLESTVRKHFGSSPMFLLVDSQSGEIKEQSNRDKGHTRGNCQPLKAIAGLSVEAIAVGGIGKGALTGLNQAGLKVFQAYPGTIADNLAQMAAEQLKELSLKDVCSGHSGPHGHGRGAEHGAGCGC